MKIVHISTSDRIGGAAIAAYRLNEAMRLIGLDSKMLVASKLSDNNDVYSIADLKGKQYKFIYDIIYSLTFHVKQYLLRPLGFFSLASFFSFHISRLALLKEADVIYIHWTNNSFISLHEIKRILNLGKPVYFFMHDMWLITGGCHHSFTCSQWKNKCAVCPNIQRKFFQNISQYVFDKKKSLPSDIHIITPSHWLTNCVKDSALFASADVVTIPNLLNTVTFRLIDRKIARAILGLPLEQKLILFAAAGGSANIYKGWNMMERISDSLFKEKIGIVLLGNRLSDDSCNLDIYSVGKLHDEYSLALLYNAVDVYVSPTMAESFGMTLIEAQACGTPVVAFNVGGVPDTMEHKLTGYLAELGNVDDLLRGIKWAFENTNNRTWREVSHAHVDKLYSYQKIANLHIENLSKVRNE